MMKIIIPVNPFINSTHNVSTSTLFIIETRLKWGYNTMIKIFNRDAPCKELFKKYDFFSAYNDYIEINIHGKDDDEYIQWRGLIESKLRQLTLTLEEFEHSNRLIVHPFPIPSGKSSMPSHPHC